MERIEKLQNKVNLLKQEITEKRNEICVLMDNIKNSSKTTKSKFYKGSYFKNITKNGFETTYRFIKITGSLVPEEDFTYKQYKLPCEFVAYTTINRNMKEYYYIPTNHITGTLCELSNEWITTKERDFEQAKKQIINFVVSQNDKKRLVAQQYYKKSLWHKPDDIPDNINQTFLIGYKFKKGTRYDVVENRFVNHNWNKILDYYDHNITQWCYISDLLPKKRGKK